MFSITTVGIKGKSNTVQGHAAVFAFTALLRAAKTPATIAPRGSTVRFHTAGGDILVTANRRVSWNPDRSQAEGGRLRVENDDGSPCGCVSK